MSWWALVRRGSAEAGGDVPGSSMLRGCWTSAGLEKEGEMTMSVKKAVKVLRWWWDEMCNSRKICF